MWIKFWDWFHNEEGWKALCGLTYIVICLFDFIIVPAWIGITRSDTLLGLNMSNLASLDPSVQIKMISAMTFQHEPFTLKGGGLFHLAFGALLTGSAITKKKPKDNNQ